MFLGGIERGQWNEMFERFRFVPLSGLFINLTLSIFKTTRKLPFLTKRQIHTLMVRKIRLSIFFGDIEI